MTTRIASTVRPTGGRRVATLPPDLRELYPDPAIYRTLPTTYGLTWSEFVAEVRRRKAEGWAAWELAKRFSREAVSP
ncbi:MAG: hypothetical protein KQH57_17320 [Actinomycetales bacterium]|nr:hypothetical protein [Actinomycetales bacterium]